MTTDPAPPILNKIYDMRDSGLKVCITQRNGMILDVECCCKLYDDAEDEIHYQLCFKDNGDEGCCNFKPDGTNMDKSKMMDIISCRRAVS